MTNSHSDAPLDIIFLIKLDHIWPNFWTSASDNIQTFLDGI